MPLWKNNEHFWPHQVGPVSKGHGLSFPRFLPCFCIGPAFGFSWTFFFFYTTSLQTPGWISSERLHGEPFPHSSSSFLMTRFLHCDLNPFSDQRVIWWPLPPGPEFIASEPRIPTLRPPGAVPCGRHQRASATCKLSPHSPHFLLYPFDALTRFPINSFVQYISAAH